MRPTELAPFLDRVLNTPGHPPVFIWGPPGCGKSSIARQVTAKNAFRLVDLRASLLDPTDFRGIPVPKDGKAVWYPPSFLPPSDSPDLWLVFLDELNLAPLLVQHSAYQLVLDRAVGEYRLPANAVVMAAGNRAEDRAGTRDMPAPLLNRFCHVTLLPNLDDWANWAIDNGVSAEVVAFLRLNSDLLFKFDPSRGQEAFPTPRSIVYADTVWRTHGGSIYSWEAIEGCVGKEWAAKFAAYLKVYQELPDVDKILAGKDSTVPNRSDLRYAIASLIGTKAQAGQMQTALSYALKLPAEHGAFLVQLIVRRPGLAQALAKTAAWREWVAKHKDLIRPE